MTPKSRRFSFSGKTFVMGVLNVTPDSFSDGGKFFKKGNAIRRGLEMAEELADIIDVGGESTRPGSRPVGVDEELARVIPVIKELSKRIKIPISVDTTKSEIAEEALKAGARIVNDISGLGYDEEIAAIVARYNASIIVMHMKGKPENMQVRPRYNDLIPELIASLKKSVNIAKCQGVPDDNIIIDPGIGFGKTVKDNLEILDRLDEFKALKKPICIGTSRKSFIGKILGETCDETMLAGTLATCVMAIMKGANIVRVHDVREAVLACRMTDAVTRRSH